jgi:hypothetical protein
MNMFRKSNLLASALVLATATFTTHTASALSLLPAGEMIASLALSARACPPGTHEGYLGKYCWRDHEGSACPAGTHLGYEGKYCWRNH